MVGNEHAKPNEVWSGRDHKDRTVRLYVYERDHIIDGHPIMGNNFTAIYDTVQTPDAVYRAAEIPPYREVFFKHSKEASYSSRLYTKTIVEYNNEDTEGFIVTAFPINKEGGNIGEKLYPQE